MARAAHEADERDRLVRQLRDIGQLVQSAYWKAAEENSRQAPVKVDWQCVEHSTSVMIWRQAAKPQRWCRSEAQTERSGHIRGTSRYTSAADNVKYRDLTVLIQHTICRFPQVIAVRSLDPAYKPTCRPANSGRR